MKPTTKWITGALVVAGVIFALSPGPIHLLNHPDSWELREQFVYLTGVSTLSLMVLSMVISLRIPGVNRRMTIIRQVDHHPPGMLDLWIVTLQKPFVHQPGQYAFLRFSHDPEPHPFSMASSGDDPRTMRFAIKSLGEFTAELANRLGVGQTVEVEGPYGEFRFDAPARRQIWIAGGIGITPFMARLEHLTHQGGSGQPIDFWYATRGDQDTLFPDSLARLCQQSGVTLYPLNSARNEYLTAQMLHEVIGSFDEVSIWFCGPPAFAEGLLKGLSAYDFDQRAFHYDSFHMR